MTITDTMIRIITSGSITQRQVTLLWNTTRIDPRQMPWTTRIWLPVFRILIVYMGMLILSVADTESPTGITRK